MLASFAVYEDASFFTSFYTFFLGVSKTKACGVAKQRPAGRKTRGWQHKGLRGGKTKACGEENKKNCNELKNEAANKVQKTLQKDDIN